MQPTKLQIVRRAFELWQQAGCPDGKDKDLARQAAQELCEEKSRPADNIRQASEETGPATTLAGVTADQLKGAPKYATGANWNWTDPARTRAIDDYYGL